MCVMLMPPCVCVVLMPRSCVQVEPQKKGLLCGKKKRKKKRVAQSTVTEDDCFR